MAKKKVPPAVRKLFADPAAMEFFRAQGARGGKIGGKVGAANMTAKARTERAREAGIASGAARKAKAKQAK